MKNISPALQSFLLGSTGNSTGNQLSFNRADLIQITLPNSQVLNVVSGANTDIVFTGSQGPNLPTAVNTSGSGTTWTNASSIEGNISYASTTITAGTNASTNTSAYLNATTFDFAIPAAINAVIGVGVDAVCYCNSSGANINPIVSAQLLVGNTTSGSAQNFAMPGLPEFYFPTKPITLQVSNLLYPNTLTSAQTNASSFGIRLQAVASGTAGVSTTVFLSDLLVTITWQGGTGTTTYYASQYGAWERGEFKNEASFRMSTQSMNLTALLPESVLYPGTNTSMMQVVNQGMFAGARVQIQTLFWPLNSSYTTGLNMGTMQLTTGQIGNVKQTGRSKVTCEVFDLLYKLNRPCPPFQIQSACRHTLFDPSCTLIASSFSTTSTLNTGSTQLYLNLDTIVSNAFPYSLGYVSFTSGQNSGLMGSIKSQYNFIAGTFESGTFSIGETVKQDTTDATATLIGINSTGLIVGTISGSPSDTGTQYWVGQTSGAELSPTAYPVTQFQLAKYLPFPVATGDELTIYPGCTKTIAVCNNIYNNLIHFGGMPFVPAPETAE